MDSRPSRRPWPSGARPPPPPRLPHAGPCWWRCPRSRALSPPSPRPILPGEHQAPAAILERITSPPTAAPRAPDPSHTPPSANPDAPTAAVATPSRAPDTPTPAPTGIPPATWALAIEVAPRLPDARPAGELVITVDSVDEANGRWSPVYETATSFVDGYIGVRLINRRAPAPVRGHAVRSARHRGLRAVRRRAAGSARAGRFVWRRRRG